MSVILLSLFFLNSNINFDINNCKKYYDKPVEELRKEFCRGSKYFTGQVITEKEYCLMGKLLNLKSGNEMTSQKANEYCNY